MNEPRTNPFVGLRPFEAEDNLYYFGRNEQTRDLLRQLHEDRFLAVVGASGSGKSSLVRSGLFPNLEAGFLVQDRDSWKVAVMKPGDAPLAHLAEALLSAVSGEGESEEFEDVIRRRGVGAIVEKIRTALEDDSANLILLVDQFEELFRFAGSASQREEAADFVSILLRLAEQKSAPVYVCLTMRSDFMGDCDRFHGLPEALNRGQYLVPRLTRKQRREAIAGPLGLSGVIMAPRLLDRLLNENLDTRDDLPILQHALMRTWEHWNGRGGDGPIDLEDYEAVGGIENALNRHADEAFTELDQSGRELARRLFQALTETDTGNRRIRRPAKISEIGAITGTSRARIESVIETFREQGRSFLVVSTKGGSEDALVDISHESLIRQWQRLREWTDEEAESAKTYRRLAETAELHREGKADVYRGIDLEVARQWYEEAQPKEAWGNRYHDGFEGAMAFLEESGQLQDAEQIQKEAKQQRLIGALLAPREAVAALSRIEEKNEPTSRNFQLAWLNTLRALDSLDELPAEIQEAERSQFVKLLTRWDLTARAFQPYWSSLPVVDPISAKEPFAIASIAFSPDDRDTPCLATGSQDGTVTIRNQVNPNEILATLDYSKSPSESENTPYVASSIAIAFRDDRDLLAVAYYATTTVDSKCVTRQQIRFWDLTNVRDPRELPPPKTKASEGAGLTVGFSPDGSLLASGSVNGSVRVWKTSDLDSPIWEDKLHTGLVSSVTFSPDGAWLASGSFDNSIWLRKLPQRPYDSKSFRITDTKQLTKHTGAVTTLAFRPMTTPFVDPPQKGMAGPFFLASGSEDRSVRLWKITGCDNAQPIAVLRDHGESIASVAFSQDGSLLASGDFLDDPKLGLTSEIRLWDSSNPEEVRVLSTLQGHWGPVYSAAFSPDGRSLGSTSKDGTVRLWDLTHPRAVQKMAEVAASQFQGHSDAVSSVAFDAAGERLFSAGADGDARIWDPSVSETCSVKRSGGFDRPVSAVALSSNGRLFVAADWLKGTESDFGEGTIRLLRLSGTESHILSEWELSSRVRTVAFSPDIKKLACGDDDGVVRIWEIPPSSAEETQINLSAGEDHAPIRSLAFDPTSTFLASGSEDGGVRIWKGLNDQNPENLRGHTDTVRSLAFSPAGRKILASASADGAVRLWDTATGEELAVLEGHTDYVASAAFSPDGETLATGSMDKTIRLWDVGDPETPFELAVLSGHTSDVNAVAFSPDGKTLASGSFDKTVRLWNLERTLAFATDDGEVRRRTRELLRDFEDKGRDSVLFQKLLLRSREHADLLGGFPEFPPNYPIRMPGENPITWMLKEASDRLID